MSNLKTVDCRGLACPQPVLNTKEALLEAASPFLVIVDNEAASTNVSRYAESQGARVTAEPKGGEFHLKIQPGQGQQVSEPARAGSTSAETNAKNLAVVVSSEGMGSGDEELGAILMAAFLDTLSHFKGEISHAIFLNAGAKLAVEGSPVLEQIRQLERIGVEVLVCGTCLSFFGIKDKLAVGSVSNMYAIIETLMKAGGIVRP